MFTMIKTWINTRLEERTSWDGAVLIAAGIAFLIFKPIASLVAYGAIAYGIWTLFKSEQTMIHHISSRDIKHVFDELRIKNVDELSLQPEQAAGYITINGDIFYSDDAWDSHHDIASAALYKYNIIDVTEPLKECNADTTFETDEFYSSLIKEHGAISYRVFHRRSGNNKRDLGLCRISLKSYKECKSKDQLRTLRRWLKLVEPIGDTFNINASSAENILDLEYLSTQGFSKNLFNEEYETWYAIYKKYSVLGNVKYTKD